jgi:hypothetical protein
MREGPLFPLGMILGMVSGSGFRDTLLPRRAPAQLDLGKDGIHEEGQSKWRMKR